jgi:hypothetical protein
MSRFTITVLESLTQIFKKATQCEHVEITRLAAEANGWVIYMSDMKPSIVNRLKVERACDEAWEKNR